MKREKLETVLEAQFKTLVEQGKLDASELEEIQDKIVQAVETQAKINALKLYVESYKEEVKEFMLEHNIPIIYSSKGKAVHKVADSTTIKKDLVLMVIDEFRTGERDTLDYEDVTETKTMESFSIRPISIKEEM